ncbi:MAG: arylesterase [Bacteroidota bacterium]
MSSYALNGSKKILFLTVLTTIIFSFSSCSNTENQKAPQSNENVSNEENVSTNNASRTIMFFGNSITAGYGLDPDQAFPAIIQGTIDSLSLDYKVVAAGNSGETSAGGLQRVDWMLRQQVDVFVLELGGNDGLRGLMPPQMKDNLGQIIDKVKSKYPDCKIILAAMESPPNMGEDYTEAFRKVFPALAEEKNVTLLPFLLEGVAGLPDLNLPDGIHPTAEGHQILADNVWKVLKPIL